MAEANGRRFDGCLICIYNGCTNDFRMEMFLASLLRYHSSDLYFYLGRFPTSKLGANSLELFVNKDLIQTAPSLILWSAAIISLALNGMGVYGELNPP